MWDSISSNISYHEFQQMSLSYQTIFPPQSMKNDWISYAFALI